jgi:hypothetical protein
LITALARLVKFKPTPQVPLLRNHFVADIGAQCYRRQWRSVSIPVMRVGASPEGPMFGWKQADPKAPGRIAEPPSLDAPPLDQASFHEASLDPASLEPRSVEQSGAGQTIAWQSPAFRRLDRPDFAETFADAITGVVFDGQTLRIELSVSRMDEAKPGAPLTGYRTPVCRLVVPPSTALDLAQKMQQVSAALAKAGYVRASSSASDKLG